LDVLAVFDWMKIEHWSYLFGLFSVGYRGIHQMFASAISDGVGKIDTMTLQFVFISEIKIIKRKLFMVKLRKKFEW